MKCVRDVVAGQGLATATADMPVVEVARIMASRNIGAVPITDGERVVGIFTERDALNRVIATGLDPARTPVRDVMSKELVIAAIGESYDTCLERMRELHIRHLIVLDSDHMAGIVSMRDLMAVDLDDKLETITQLNAYVHSVPVGVVNRPL